MIDCPCGHVKRPEHAHQLSNEIRRKGSLNDSWVCLHTQRGIPTRARRKMAKVPCNIAPAVPDA
jgi:hypothetical protein